MLSSFPRALRGFSGRQARILCEIKNHYVARSRLPSVPAIKLKAPLKRVSLNARQGTWESDKSVAVIGVRDRPRPFERGSKATCQS